MEVQSTTGLEQAKSGNMCESTPRSSESRRKKAEERGAPSEMSRIITDPATGKCYCRGKVLGKVQRKKEMQHVTFMDVTDSIFNTHTIFCLCREALPSATRWPTSPLAKFTRPKSSRMPACLNRTNGRRYHPIHPIYIQCNHHNPLKKTLLKCVLTILMFCFLPIYRLTEKSSCTEYSITST